MDILFYSLYNVFPQPVQQTLMSFVEESLKIEKCKLQIAMSILTHITANQYVYSYIDNPNSNNLKQKQVAIYNEIKNNISPSNFKKLSTYLHVIISQYNKLVMKNPTIQHILIVRRNLIINESKRIKNEYDNNNIFKSDYECWFEAEKSFLHSNIDINKLLK